MFDGEVLEDRGPEQSCAANMLQGSARLRERKDSISLGDKKVEE